MIRKALRLASPEKVCVTLQVELGRAAGWLHQLVDVLTATLKWLILCCELHFNKKRRHKDMSSSGSSLSPLTLTAWTQGHPAPGQQGNLNATEGTALPHSNLTSTRAVEEVGGRRGGRGGHGLRGRL